MKNYKKIEQWYDKEYRKKKEGFGVGLEAYRDFIPFLLEYSHKNFSYKEISQKKLLDVACGQGYLLRLATNYGFKTHGIDISEESIKLSKKNAPYAQCKKGKAENIEFLSRTFDYITCVGSLEHFLSINYSLKEIHRVGKYDCKYCILVPNGSSWFHNSTEQQEINEQLLKLNQWKSVFKKNGFNILAIKRDSYHWRKDQSLIKKILCYLTPKRFFHSLIFILEKQHPITVHIPQRPVFRSI